MIGDIVVAGALTFCALLPSVCYLNAAWRNVQCSLILYAIELGYNATEATTNICCAKSEDTIDHSTITRWLKKFCSDCKNIDSLARSDWPKTLDSEAMFQAIQVNLAGSTWRVSGNMALPSLVWVFTFMTSA